MRRLYARAVLWLLRPALRLWAAEQATALVVSVDATRPPDPAEATAMLASAARRSTVGR